MSWIAVIDETDRINKAKVKAEQRKANHKKAVVKTQLESAQRQLAAAQARVDQLKGCLWVDDERPAPEGWLSATTSVQAIVLLKTNAISRLSLDHDLGGDDTGYKVLEWLEEQAAAGVMKHLPNEIQVHSANPVGQQRMRQAIASIQRLRYQR